MAVVAVFVALTFALTGLVGVTLLTESIVAQNETGGNMTGTANSSAFSGGAGMAPETKR